MLSYRHAFHAGSHADVLKHLVQVLILQYLVGKEGKPLRYIDTHAGEGCYNLHRSFASKNREYAGGVARLWNRDDLPPPLQAYLNVVRSVNPTGQLIMYPGSPAVASQLLLPEHRLQLFELHSTDAVGLQQWAQKDRRISVKQEDGFAALKAILPPIERRALVMIDPPYEVKSDYRQVLDTLQGACKKFANGIFAVWYPLLDRQEVTHLVKRLEAMPVKYLLAELPVHSASDGDMYGSGMFVINPPWRLYEQLAACLPYLQQTLAAPGATPYRLIDSTTERTF
jgi:23S rRNA (adenine2030-N6)-methyltransferase